jgi:hypothetical protein
VWINLLLTKNYIHFAQIFIFIFKSQLIHTFTESKCSNCFILYFEYRNIFIASDLIFTGGKCHMLLFLEWGILSEMFYFKLLKKGTTCM